MTYVEEGKRLQNLLEVYDYFAANPMRGMSELPSLLGLCETAVRYRIGVAIRLGYLYKSDAPHYHGSGDRYLYRITKKERPSEMPERRHNRSGRPRNDEPGSIVKRRIVPAVQIGMHRDAFDALFFGPARAEVQA